MKAWSNPHLETSLRRIGFWLPLLICTWFALGGGLPKSTVRVGDVPLHLLAFVYLSAALSIAYMRDRWWWVVVAMLSYGGAIELIQYWLPHRHAEWKDFGVDVIGIGVGLGCYRLFGERLWEAVVMPVVRFVGRPRQQSDLPD